jgi:Fur family peroxide stress response transcriptional regulator
METEQQQAILTKNTFVARAFAEAGLRSTVQRRVLYGELCGRCDHPDAELLFDAVKQRLPGVSLATVYRNLRLFVEAGMARELTLGGSNSRWDGNTERHHHLLCNACGRVSDFFSEELDTVGGSLKVAPGFQVQGLDIRVTGICGECRAD